MLHPPNTAVSDRRLLVALSTSPPTLSKIIVLLIDLFSFEHLEPSVFYRARFGGGEANR